MPNPSEKDQSAHPAVGNYRSLPGSLRTIGPRSNLIGPADPGEAVPLTIVVRRRPDGPPMPGLDDWQGMLPSRRKSLSVDEFARLYGASQADLDAVADFAEQNGMTVVESHAARRTVAVTGTVAQVNAAFGIHLNRYDSPLPRSGRARAVAGPGRAAPARQVHRSHEGNVQVPQALASIITGIFGLDDRKLLATLVDPYLPTGLATVPLVCQHYGWPITPLPTPQTVGILAAYGFDESDIDLYYQNLNMSLLGGGGFLDSPPGSTPDPVPPNAVTGTLVAPSSARGTLVVALGTNPGIDGAGSLEPTLDIAMASTVAQGATIAVYFMDKSSQSWVTALKQAIQPEIALGQPQPSVVSISYVFALDDAPSQMNSSGLSEMDVANISAVFQEAHMMGVTVCAASGDWGTDNEVGDGYAHVPYPASDPWVLSCGGTSVGMNMIDRLPGREWVEYIWNQEGAATGGGVSAFFNGATTNPAFRPPGWQAGKGIPYSLNDGSVGRGVPDVAANAGALYSLYLGGVYVPVGGTSAAAPLIAGFIAQTNAYLGYNAGFLNPLLYATNGSACRKITPGVIMNGGSQIGPDSNAYAGVTGYPGTQTGWDACTGWGVFVWDGLLNAIRNPPPTPSPISPKDKETKEKESAEKILHKWPAPQNLVQS